MKRFALYILLGVAAIGCKKDRSLAPNGGASNTTLALGSTFDMIRDSVYLYAKEDYYWYDALPDYATFNPRSFTGSTDIAALKAEVNKLSQYKINPLTNLPYEYVATSVGSAKYSFIDEGNVSQVLSGVTGDFGFGIFYNTTTDLRIKYINPGSPADAAGIKRGYQITSVNGNSNLAYDNGTNLNFILNAYSNSNTIALVLKRPDGTTLSATLNTATYTHNPVLVSKVIDQGDGHKTGYLVFSSFVTPTIAKPALDAAFNAFRTAGITDLVVDLRYNGGGFVSTAEYLTNLIAPASASNKLMYNTYYNPTLQAGKAVLLKNQVRKDASSGQTYNYSQIDFPLAGNAVNFGANHPLALSRVFFIVTGSTASASELTINNLRPYVNVQLIGNTSYGKPVGFFDIKINKYQLYVPEFETKNANGGGGYYTGMKPGSADYPGYFASDDVSKDFGDPSERLLGGALSYISAGKFPTASGVSTQSTSRALLSIDEQNNAANTLDADQFKGMVMRDFKHH